VQRNNRRATFLQEGRMTIRTPWASLDGQLIVSCQAAEDDPLRDPMIMVALARAASLGGAAGLRANGPDDIAAIRAAVDMPLIGLQKRVYRGIQCITPTIADAGALVAAGASIVAVEATVQREELTRYEDIDHFATLARRIHADLGAAVLADISTVDEALDAVEQGADLVATTLAGYTPDSPPRDEPDLSLVRDLARRLSVPVIAEGHIWTPDQASAALDAGAFAVVVGSAITRPRLLTERFVRTLHDRALKG